MSKDIVVAEGISAVWFYHLRRASAEKALCGANTLFKSLPTRLWRFVGHMGERYCSKCQVEAESLGVQLAKANHGPGASK